MFLVNDCKSSLTKTFVCVCVWSPCMCVCLCVKDRECVWESSGSMVALGSAMLSSPPVANIRGPARHVMETFATP